MSTMRVEFIKLGTGELYDKAGPNIINGQVGTPQSVSVTTSATAPASRPAVPVGTEYARLTALDANIIASWGANPTAAVGEGLLVMSGQVEVMKVAEGDLLSFIEV